MVVSNNDYIQEYDKTGDGTEFVIDAIEFNSAIPEHLFSKAALRR